TYEEWQGVVGIINDFAALNVPFILLYDLAYFDYDKRGSNAALKNICLFQELKEHAMVILAFSGSKTLGLYGLRIGAQIAMCKTKESADEFLAANDYSARGKWSAATTLGQNVVTLSLTKYKEEFKEELESARALLIARANAFLKESKKVGLKHYPYECGFFVKIPCEQPSVIYETLKKKGLYVLPLERGIRLTLSSITLPEVIRAVHLISETIKEFE
ncbi:MAG: aminotransferase class I/II-fold pyridoxal phosphate-dependent enzyme, partial [Anaeroplasmataceae bacterium]|nr:aminotransferase class I/II-fold pyridoxal phosphate-dependent enzyme [Anaeroplasmataceae bacterium]